MKLKKKTIWIYGLSASGKSSIANALHHFLLKKNINNMVLDGDIVRKNINKDLSFSQQDRFENIRRCSEIAKILNHAHVTVVASFITPLESHRALIKNILQNDVLLVFLNCPIKICIQRDPKGLYKKALSGQLKTFTGISDPFEIPKNTSLIIDTSQNTISECVHQIIAKIT